MSILLRHLRVLAGSRYETQATLGPQTWLRVLIHRVPHAYPDISALFMASNGAVHLTIVQRLIHSTIIWETFRKSIGELKASC